MADLYHLLDELEDEEDRHNGNEYDDDDGDGKKQGRPSLAVTEATEPMMSDDWDSPGRGGSAADVPAALQEALRADDDDGEEGYEEVSKFNLDGGSGDAAAATLEDTQHVENELYGRLQQHWMQERNCPELLAYEEGMVNEVKEQIRERQDYIDQKESSNDSVDVLMATMAQLDLDRIKFVLSDWLSTRLAKIEAHPLHMRESVDQMSDAEIAYLKQYGALLENHLRQTVLDHIPEAWQNLDEPHMIDKPDYEAYHFWLVKEPIDTPDMDQHEVGTCLVARYSDMTEYFREGKAEILL